MVVTSVWTLTHTVPSAAADDFGIKIEPGIAIPITAPQSDIYDTGAAQTLKVLFGITPYLDVGPSGSFLFLPAADPLAGSGTAWGLGASARLKRPHAATSVGGLSPWIDLDLSYQRTGDLNRPGFALATGVAAPFGADHNYWVGPFIRYAQTIQTHRDGYDNRDAKVLIVGLSLELGTGRARTPAPTTAVPEREPEVPAPVTVVSCPDRDGDTFPDTIDRCPDVVGEMETFGCPRYEKVIVQRDMLQLKDKLYFDWDRATLTPASLLLLDEVAKVLTDNPGFRVQVEGHTDSSGGEAHNQSLSEQRADAVLAYLTSHGVAKDRLVSKGFSSSDPLDTNTTAAGRENNRRVEFVVNFVIVNNGSTP